MTTWDEIKERVEIKVGEDIDSLDFTILANSALSELNEAAYTEAPAYRYTNELILRGNPSHIIYGKEIQDGDIIELPFEYGVGSNELDFTANENMKDLTLSEVGRPSEYSNELRIETDNTFGKKFKLTITRNIFKKSKYKKQCIVKVPENFSTIVRLEGILSNGDSVVIKPASINSAFPVSNDTALLKTFDLTRLDNDGIYLWFASTKIPVQEK